LLHLRDVETLLTGRVKNGRIHKLVVCYTALCTSSKTARTDLYPSFFPIFQPLFKFPWRVSVVQLCNPKLEPPDPPLLLVSCWTLISRGPSLNAQKNNFTTPPFQCLRKCGVKNTLIQLAVTPGFSDCDTWAMF
jgi:hypothetical protein